MAADLLPRGSIWAAGCVVARRSRTGEARYLVVHRPGYNDWSLPKGKIDKGETFLETALRELEEETGIVGSNPRLIGSVGYDTKTGNSKIVKWWVVEVHSGEFTVNSEVDKVKWLSRDKAVKKLDYRNDRAVLDRADRMYRGESAGTVFLVRHAWAGVRDDTDPSDRNRKLDSRGKKQRKAIRDHLLTVPLTRVLSSDFKRCTSTVKPLASRLGVRVETAQALTEGRHPEQVMDLIGQLDAEPVVLCTHGDVIADVIGHLMAEGVPMDGPIDSEKGSIWELRTARGRVVSGRYVPAS